MSAYDATARSNDRTVDTTGGANRGKLQQQAGELLTQPDASREIQAARFGGGTANVTQQGVESALERDPSADLLDKLVTQDKRAAAEFAVKHTELHTHALHGVEDAAFQEDVRVRLTGGAESDT